MTIREMLFGKNTEQIDEDNLESTGYVGPKLNDNAIWLKRNRRVDHIALGESHMVVLGHHVGVKQEVYVMGSNQWGQLGINPFNEEAVFID